MPDPPNDRFALGRRGGTELGELQTPDSTESTPVRASRSSDSVPSLGAHPRSAEERTFFGEDPPTHRAKEATAVVVLVPSSTQQEMHAEEPDAHGGTQLEREGDTLVVLDPAHRRAEDKEFEGVDKSKKDDIPGCCAVAVSKKDQEVARMPSSSRHAKIGIHSPSSSATTPQTPDTHELEMSDERMDNHSASSPATTQFSSPPTQPSCPPLAASTTTTVSTASTQRSSTRAAGAEKEPAAEPSSEAECDDGDGAVRKSDEQEEENATRPSSSRDSNNFSSVRAAAGSATTPDVFSDQRDGGGTHINGDDATPPLRERFDTFDEGLGLEGTTPVAPSAGAETAEADVVRPPDIAAVIRPVTLPHGPGHPLGSAAGGVGSSSGGGGGFGYVGGAFTVPEVFTDRVSTYSQVLHVVLTFAVFVLVAFSKSADGGVSGCKGGSSTRSSSRRSSRLRPRQSRRSGRGARFFSSVRSWRLVRVLRAAWSKLWHAAEKNLGSRWRAAGQALASLRRAWAGLWASPPHAEAHILAEALASPPLYRKKSEDRLRYRGSVVDNTGASEPWRRRRRRRNSQSAPEHAEDNSPGGGAGFFPRGGGDSNDLGARPVEINCLDFLRLCGYRRLAGAGGARGSRAPKFLLLLDLDETLVHCSAHLMEPARRRSGGAVRPDLKVELRGGAPSDRPACMYAWKRPYLDVFLSVVSRWYEIGVFTSGRQCVAEAVIDLIDQRCVIGKRFYRDSCTRRDGGGGGGGGGNNPRDRGDTDAALDTAAGPGSSSETVKDLRVVGSEHFPLRTVLVDNQPRTVMQQANVLPVRSWFPSDLEDRQLLELLPVLLALTSCQDVRSVLGLRPGVARGGVAVSAVH